MGRPSKGWRLRKRPGRPYEVRFTHGGTEHNLGLATFDEAEAHRRAAEVYADTVRGARRVVRRTSAGGKSLAEVALSWLSEIAPEISARTRATYAIYAETHWCSHWPTLEAVSSESAATYARARLRKVQGPTVAHEISALRRFLGWCVEKGWLEAIPELPTIGKRTVGTRHKQGRRGPPVELTPAETKRLVAAIPERGRRDYPLRARFIVQYETGLRPTLIDALSVPENWTPGSSELRISPEIDKIRNGRPVPLTQTAVRALESAAPESGIIFGARDTRHSIRKAAIAVLGTERGERFTSHYFRHNRLTHWAETSDNLAGIMYLAGHKRPDSTARYFKPSVRAARDVLESGRKRRSRDG